MLKNHSGSERLTKTMFEWIRISPISCILGSSLFFVAFAQTRTCTVSCTTVTTGEIILCRSTLDQSPCTINSGDELTAVRASCGFTSLLTDLGGTEYLLPAYFPACTGFLSVSWCLAQATGRLKITCVTTTATSTAVNVEEEGKVITDII